MITKPKHKMGETVMGVVFTYGKNQIRRIVIGEVIGYYNEGYILLIKDYIEFASKFPHFTKDCERHFAFRWVDCIPHKTKTKALKYLRENIKERVVFT